MIDNTTDVVITTVPFTDTELPLMAPAVLKSIVVKANKTCTAIDLNAVYLDQISNHPDRELLLNFFKDGVLDSKVGQYVEDMLDEIVENLISYNPKYICLSVFTYDCKQSTKYLCWKIRKKYPHIKLIVGGAGLFENLAGGSTLGEELLNNNLIDFYVKGDGEKLLYEYFANDNLIIGANTDSWKQMLNSELNELPMPDYDDYRFDLYKRPKIPILGSRGCVRRCTFCDIHVHWEDFTFRAGQNIFDEMTKLYKKYQIRHFKFQDSLINGNMKEYRTLTKLLTEYNLKNPEESFSWSSFFIFKPKAHFKEEDWYYTAKSGATNLLIGIESFSEEARFHLGKKFTNEDIDFGLEMLKKYNIYSVLLFLIGYITETEEDHQNAIQWLKDHVKYKDIITFNLGTPLGILNNTPLQKNFDSLGLEWVGKNQTDWKNQNSDPQTRARWYRELSKTVNNLGYTELHPFDNHYILERMEKGKFVS